ncbi:hypothetical protein SAICODRAFT_70597 [Saitoella complicata NRRL Y-17804]|uniref:assimilatory sulfite reductase (NADPH) n=1 Tax=Saitoella complicata (strain BCRC 22490 / CBS 7301 / JCM 7358 / NBRC 10748 / NRRL Y-17804) TaxID=698492 RepID=A0A0E9NAR0_SAICN|nr:uncharacterized protein SAICODRAFT_70597 [Saitoella complicata NRRL Y-17804]ODQ53902.1 hypothetical protein SAICODRAFT_70597 [Saitoella complicata NRRL Y-17804]GAO46883.1 hypothetical protein G7K_1101-t1 [Saitoella complicata NRRL Y-17804]
MSTTAAFPWGVPAYDSLSGPTYLTAQQLVQQVGYALASKIYSYSSEGDDLDTAVAQWNKEGVLNGYGRLPVLAKMQSRSGAGAMVLGDFFSIEDFKQKYPAPHAVIASTQTLATMQPILTQLALLYSAATPFVAHVSASDYSAANAALVANYASALYAAQETGVSLISSSSAHEIQHMALFASLISSVTPAIHVYDGVRLARESCQVVDVLDAAAVKRTYTQLIQAQDAVGKKVDAAERISKILNNLNSELGTNYGLFEYEGHAEAEQVLVVFGSTEARIARRAAAELSKAGQKLGVVVVRVYRPFSDKHFLEALPASVKKVSVLGQVADKDAVAQAYTQSALYADVVAALATSSVNASVKDIKYSTEKVFTIGDIADYLGAPSFDFFAGEEAVQYVHWDVDATATAAAPAKVAKLLSEVSGKNVSFNAVFDNLSQAGIIQTEIRSTKSVVEAPFAIENADVVVVQDAKILNSYDVLGAAKEGAKVLLRTSIKDADYEKKLPAGFRRAVAAKKAELYVLNVAELGEKSEASAETDAVALQLAFLKVARPELDLAGAAEKVAALNSEDAKSILPAVSKIVENLAKGLNKVEVPATWAEAEVAQELPTTIRANSTEANTEKEIEERVGETSKWHEAAKGLLFKEAYETKASIRPDLPERNFIVKVKSNKRLTPADYDRNIFHIEFDTTGTGLTYEIGEALGVHAHNDRKEVEDFIDFYGLDASELVNVPSREDPAYTETRTIFQALLQNIDLFGRPGKKFYEQLAEFATDEAERKQLLTLASAEGTTEFKRRAEVDTIHYVDLLHEFKSARPAFGQLAQIVPPLKRREYSIASSQKVRPNQVDLLVVAVDWRDPTGRDRYGQATRYLSRLEIGDELVVSVKPSVMKLPPKDTQPIIMAGLGTGLAPFRAFVEYRAWQAAQGIEIGKVFLYLGSRHRREEYLFGEEWEAYLDAGIITILGCAFSRDQPQKVYIQDKLEENLVDVKEALLEGNGSFYLCGPTWPVPAITEVLSKAVTRNGVEEMKEEGRYVLEVY